MNRLAAAMIAYVGLGILTWTTISDGKLRAGTLVILGLFAFKSWVRRRDVMHPDEERDFRQAEGDRGSEPMLGRLAEPKSER